jgi:hypothetical protein
LSTGLVILCLLLCTSCCAGSGGNKGLILGLPPAVVNVHYFPYCCCTFIVNSVLNSAAADTLL